jgi:SAM-dependent methyltransferase
VGATRPGGPAARAWAEALDAWRIPDEILRAAPEDPWHLPVGPFARRADEAPSEDSPSRRRAVEALPAGGSVLDVGSGAGAASLPLAPPAGLLVAVDEREDMLAAFAERAWARGIAHREIVGSWPEVAGAAPTADVVVCHHVLYGVSAIEPFVRALTRRARHRVVVEVTARHPRAWLNPLWRALHGLERPARPTADDLLGVLSELGLDVAAERWRRPWPAGPPEERVPAVRRALCLPADRDRDVADALARHPPPPEQELLTIWWPGAA